MQPYAGNVAQPFPPLSGAHWMMMTGEHEAAVRRVPAMLGALPDWHYHDDVQPEGNTIRFFAFRTPTGQREIGALGFLATSKAVRRAMRAGTLGRASTLGDDTVDTGEDGDTPGDPTDPNSGDSGGSDTGASCEDGYVWDSTSQTCIAAAPDANTCPSGQQPLDPTNPEAGCTPIQSGQVSGPSTGVVGQTTGEPIPPSSASCTWTPDATNAEVVGVAVNISYNNKPAAWADQSIFQYKATDGSLWSLAMWWQSGHKMVSTFRCVPTGNGVPGSPTASTSSSSTGLWIALGLLALGGLAIAGFAAGSPVTSA